MAGVTLLEADGVGRRGTGGEWLLRGVSLAIRRGERVALTGASGSGKTLLLRSLALLDPTDEGSVRWRGGPLPDYEVPAYRRQAVYLHQRPVLVEGSVEENLRIPFTLSAARGSPFPEARARELLHRLGREEALLSRAARNLSGGEGQLVALLRALLVAPSLLLLDEPTASLDDAATGLLEELVDGWLREGAGERALLWVTHDRAQAARVAARALHLRGGTLSSREPPP